MTRLAHIARPALIAVLLVTTARAAWFGVRVVAFPHPLDLGEGVVLDQVMSLSRFETIYPPEQTDPPFVIAHYPPLFQMSQVPFALLFGPNLWSGRAFSLLSAFAAAAFLGLIVHHFTKDRLAGTATALFLFSVPQIWSWSPLYRIDALALALSTAALLAVVKRPARVILPALLLTAAVYTRQSFGLAAPLAAFVYLCRVESVRTALRLALLTAVAGFGLFGLLHLLTDGGFFFHAVEGNVYGQELDELGYAWRRLARFIPILLAVGAVFLVFGRREGRAWWLATPYLVGGTLLALTAGQPGAAANYVFEFISALALVAGLALGSGSRMLGLVATLALVVQAGILCASESPLAKALEQKLSEEAGYQELRAAIEAKPGDLLLGEDLAYLPLTGRRAQFHPFTLTLRAKQGKWDQTPLLERIRERQYAAIVLYRGNPWSLAKRWTPEMLEAIRTGYRLESTILEREVWVPCD